MFYKIVTIIKLHFGKEFVIQNNYPNGLMLASFLSSFTNIYKFESIDAKFEALFFTEKRELNR